MGYGACSARIYHSQRPPPELAVDKAHYGAFVAALRPAAGGAREVVRLREEGTTNRAPQFLAVETGTLILRCSGLAAPHDRVLVPQFCHGHSRPLSLRYGIGFIRYLCDTSRGAHGASRGKAQGVAGSPQAAGRISLLLPARIGAGFEEHVTI